MVESHQQKVFGLGLSKTGTSSLTEALNRLGINSIHYPHDDETYEDLRAGNYRLRILEEWQGIIDIPVAPYYAQLDKIYPHSKFILTLRGREAWLRSCEVHWRLMMDWWHGFPQFKRFHEFIGACVYGTIEFNRERFSYVYDLHERNVRDYFHDRPNNLLVIDICGGEGWEKLCPFLGCEVPDEPFPHANEWMHLLLEAAADVSRFIPEGETFILVDEQGFGSGFANKRRALPFLERDGEYFGLPIDDETAITELERLRAAGANYIIFGFPAFWWLNYYKEFNRYLRSRFPVVAENKRLVIFDSRASVMRNIQSS